MRQVRRFLGFLALTAVAVLWAGCEDKQCKADLQACKTAGETQTKSMEALKAENTALQAKASQVDQLAARVAELTQENEKLKAAPPAPPPPPAAKKK